MKALLFLLLLTGCATPSHEVQITVPKERAAQCQAQGGCGLLSLAEVRSMLKKAHEEGMSDAMDELDSHGCKRGNT